MKKVIKSSIVLMLVIGLAGVAQAEFTQPTPEQIAAAAATPSQLASLLADASPQQAANVVKDVLVAIAGQNLTPELQKTRVQSVIQVAFTTVSAESHGSFANALGTSLGNDPVLSLTKGLVSNVQAATASFSVPDSGVNLAQVFGTSFGTAKSSTAGAASDAASQAILALEDTPAAPPVASPYAGQSN